MSCYSIGQSKRSTEFKQGAFVPGPGAYDPPTQFKITPPAWKYPNSFIFLYIFLHFFQKTIQKTPPNPVSTE